MAITRLEQTLIDNAKEHQKALAAYYQKFNAGQFDGDIEYWQHSGALTDLVMLPHYDSGLSPEAAGHLILIDQQDMDAQMRPFREWGQAALPPALADVVGKLKVGDKLLQALGAIERSESQQDAAMVRPRADTYAKSAMEHDQELSYSEWLALDKHIQERVAMKPFDVRFAGPISGKGKPFLSGNPIYDVRKFGVRSVMITQSLDDLERLPQATKDRLIQIDPSLEALIKLHGRQVALLNQDELALLRSFMDQGRKSGVSINFDTDANADRQTLAEMNSVSALEILAAANSYIRVHVSALEILAAANHEGTPQ